MIVLKLMFLIIIIACSQGEQLLSELAIPKFAYNLREGTEICKGDQFWLKRYCSGQTDFGGGKSLIPYMNILMVYRCTEW